VEGEGGSGLVYVEAAKDVLPRPCRGSRTWRKPERAALDGRISLPWRGRFSGEGGSVSVANLAVFSETARLNSVWAFLFLETTWLVGVGFWPKCLHRE
jgi:hypothetical protein